MCGIGRTFRATLGLPRSEGWVYTLTPDDITAMGEGDETVTATATDEAGNISAEGSYDLTVDTVAPTFTSGNSGDIPVNSAITVTVYDADAAETGGDPDDDINYSLSATRAGMTIERVVTDSGGSARTYSLTAVGAAVFDIDDDNGEVTYKEMQAIAIAHSVDIVATDLAGNRVVQTVAILVTDPDADPLAFGESETIAPQRYAATAAITPLTLPQATGGIAPVIHALMPIPNGLAFNASTRVLSGIPGMVSDGILTYTATDSAASPASVMLTFQVTVFSEPLVFGETIAPQGYTATAAITPLPLPQATGGIAPLSYTLTPIPDGLTFSDDGTTRHLAGTPDMASDVALTYTATDSAIPPASAMLTFQVTVFSAPTLDAITPNLQVYTVTQMVDVTLPGAMGGVGPFTYAITRPRHPRRGGDLGTRAGL